MDRHHPLQSLHPQMSKSSSLKRAEHTKDEKKDTRRYRNRTRETDSETHNFRRGHTLPLAEHDISFIQLICSNHQHFQFPELDLLFLLNNRLFTQIGLIQVAGSPKEWKKSHARPFHHSKRNKQQYTPRWMSRHFDFKFACGHSNYGTLFRLPKFNDFPTFSAVHSTNGR